MILSSPAAPGDIILISPPRRDINLSLQGRIRRATAIHSHVAISLYQYSLIHATPGPGVQIKSIATYLKERNTFTVYRHKLALSEEKSQLLADHLRYHHLQRYSLFNFYCPSWRHSFCSELAAKAYAKAGIQIADQHEIPGKVLPIDIHRHVSSHEEWADITHEYKAFFLDPENSELLDAAAKIERKVVVSAQYMGLHQQPVVDYLNGLNKRQGVNFSQITPPMEFWSNQLVRQSRAKILLHYWKRMLKEAMQLLWNKLRRPPS